MKISAHQYTVQGTIFAIASVGLLSFYKQKFTMLDTAHCQQYGVRTLSCFHICCSTGWHTICLCSRRSAKRELKFAGKEMCRKRH